MNGLLDFCWCSLMLSRWRLHRRIFHQQFRQAAIPTYHPELLRSAQMLSVFCKTLKLHKHVQCWLRQLMLILCWSWSPSGLLLHLYCLSYMIINRNQRWPSRSILLKYTDWQSPLLGTCCYGDGNFSFPYVHNASLVRGQISISLVPFSLQLPVCFLVPHSSERQSSVTKQAKMRRRFPSNTLQTGWRVTSPLNRHNGLTQNHNQSDGQMRVPCGWYNE